MLLVLQQFRTRREKEEKQLSRNNTHFRREIIFNLTPSVIRCSGYDSKVAKMKETIYL